MAEIDGNLLQQMIGFGTARAEAKPTSVSPAHSSDLPPIPAPWLNSPETNEDFLREQAVQPAPEPARPPEPSLVVLTPEQLADYGTPTPDAPQELPAADPAVATTEQPTPIQQQGTEKPKIKDVLGSAREHGRELRGEVSVFDRLIRAKNRVKEALSGVTDVLVKKGHTINRNVTDVHDLYVGLRDDAEIRKQVADIAVDATREVIDVPFAIAGEALEKMLTVKIHVGGKEYVPIDEMIKTAETIESGVKNTAKNAVELAHMTARGIKNRIQDSLDIARIARNLTLAKLAEDRKRDRETMQKRIESVENGVWLAQEILRWVERGIDRVESKGDTPKHLQNVATAKRQEAFSILGTLIARKDAIFGIRQLTTPEPAVATQTHESAPAPVMTASSEAPEPITSSSDPRYPTLSEVDQFRILQEEYNAKHPQPTPSEEAPSPNPSEQALDVNHPHHPNSTIL